MFTDYVNYIKQLNDGLIRRGIDLGLKLDRDRVHFSDQVLSMEQYLYFNEMLCAVGSQYKIPDVTGVDYVSYDEFLRRKIYDEYMGIWHSRMEELLKQPENAGVVTEKVQVLDIKNRVAAFNSILNLQNDSIPEDTGDFESRENPVYGDYETSENLADASMPGVVSEGMYQESDNPEDYMVSDDTGGSIFPEESGDGYLYSEESEEPEEEYLYSEESEDDEEYEEYDEESEDELYSEESEEDDEDSYEEYEDSEDEELYSEDSEDDEEYEEESEDSEDEELYSEDDEDDEDSYEEYEEESEDSEDEELYFEDDEDAYDDYVEESEDEDLYSEEPDDDEEYEEYTGVDEESEEELYSEDDDEEYEEYEESDEPSEDLYSEDEDDDEYEEYAEESEDEDLYSEDSEDDEEYDEYEEYAEESEEEDLYSEEDADEDYEEYEGESEEDLYSEEDDDEDYEEYEEESEDSEDEELYSEDDEDDDDPIGDYFDEYADSNLPPIPANPTKDIGIKTEKSDIIGQRGSLTATEDKAAETGQRMISGVAVGLRNLFKGMSEQQTGVDNRGGRTRRN